jgi:hypothetical protein
VCRSENVAPLGPANIPLDNEEASFGVRSRRRDRRSFRARVLGACGVVAPHESNG